MADIFVAPKHKFTIENGTSVNILSTFCENPKGVFFQTQKKDESIVLFLRSHLVTNIPWITITLILIILPLVIPLVLPLIGINLESPVTVRFATVLTLFYYFIVFSYAFISFLTWFYNILIITNERVIDIDYSDVVIHNIAETKLNHIEDVNYTQSGFIHTLINYGNLFIQTAGTERNFEAISIPNPREATHIITDLTGRKNNGY